MYFTNVVMIIESISYVLVLDAMQSGARCYQKLKRKSMREKSANKQGREPRIVEVTLYFNSNFNISSPNGK